MGAHFLAGLDVAAPSVQAAITTVSGRKRIVLQGQPGGLFALNWQEPPQNAPADFLADFSWQVQQRILPAGQAVTWLIQQVETYVCAGAGAGAGAGSSECAGGGSSECAGGGEGAGGAASSDCAHSPSDGTIATLGNLTAASIWGEVDWQSVLFLSGESLLPSQNGLATEVTADGPKDSASGGPGSAARFPDWPVLVGTGQVPSLSLSWVDPHQEMPEVLYIFAFPAGFHPGPAYQFIAQDQGVRVQKVTARAVHAALRLAVGMAASTYRDTTGDIGAKASPAGSVTVSRRGTQHV